jgi:hypothetical protein
VKRAVWIGLWVGLILDQLLWINSIAPQFGLKPENFPFELGGAFQFTDFIFLSAFIAPAIFGLNELRQRPRHVSWGMIAFLAFIVLVQGWILAQWYLGAPGLFELLPESWAQAIVNLLYR